MVAIIDHIPRIQLSDIKELIRRQTGTNQKLMQLITLNNIEYRITVSIESKDVVFRWKFKDKDKEVKVKLKQNLAIWVMASYGIFFVPILDINAGSFL